MDNEREVQQQPEIGISPIPPHQGSSVTITYTGELPATLRVEFGPNGTPFEITVEKLAGKVIDVPSGATSIVVSDPSGQAEGNTSVISP